MDITKSNIVKSIAGRDAEDLFFVLTTEGDFVLLADGKRHKVEAPKRKRRKHVAFVCQCDAPIAGKIKSNEKVTNSELRKAIAAIGGGNLDQEG